MVQYANHPQVAQNAPNKGRYDGGIRNFDSVSYPDAKGGNNGLTISTLSFAALPAGARDLIEWIRQGDARAGPFGRGAFDNNRISAAYGNFANHLPAGGAYQEYGYTDAGLEPGEQDVARLVHDTVHDNFYVTITHYRVYQMRTADGAIYRRNPFYRVKDIPFDKVANLGVAKPVKAAPRGALEMPRPAP